MGPRCVARGLVRIWPPGGTRAHPWSLKGAKEIAEHSEQLRLAPARSQIEGEPREIAATELSKLGSC